MPIIHNFTDRRNRKIQFKSIAILLIILGVTILVSIFVPPYLKPKSNSNVPNPTINKESNFCINIKNSELELKLIEYIERNNIKLNVVQNSKDNCEIEIARNIVDTNEYTLGSSKLYLVVTSFKSPLEKLSSNEIINSLSNQKYKNYDLVWNRDVDNFLRSKYSFGVGQTIYSDQEIEKKLALQNNVIAIIPFENKSISSKLITIDNFDITSTTFLSTIYPFTDIYWYKTSSVYKTNLEDIFTNTISIGGIDNSKFTDIILTGSSFVSADLYSVNILGGSKYDYMVSSVKDIVRNADISQLSNEVSIVSNCIQKISSSYLCTFEKNLNIIKDLGIDIVDVSGNHIMDFGYQTFINTLNWYKSNKIQTIGGGVNLSDARQPEVVNRNNLKVSFLGYNYIPPYSYYATKNRAGSTNVSHAYITEDLKKAKKLSDIAIVDMNWSDEYQTIVDSGQKTDGDFAISQGATIVNGVNSYTPLGFKINKESSIFYGLGGFINPYSNSGIIVKHTFYEKKYFNIELIPILYDSKKRILLAEGSQKDKILNSLYKQSVIIYDGK